MFRDRPAIDTFFDNLMEVQQVPTREGLSALWYKGVWSE
jgi:hypothetical protein